MIIAWIISILVAGYLGYFWRETIERIKQLEVSVKKLLNKRENREVQNPSSLLDPDDVMQMARFEHDEQIRKLNPDL